MATYYRWRKSTVTSALELEKTCTVGQWIVKGVGSNRVYYSATYEINENEVGLTGTIENETITSSGTRNIYLNYWYIWGSTASDRIFTPRNSWASVGYDSNGEQLVVGEGTVDVYQIKNMPGTSQGYVYSTSSSAYPNGGVSGSYYYDQRTTVTSPTVSSNLTYSSSINATLSSSVQLQWTGAQSNTSYPVTEYEISYAINNINSWQVAGTTGVLTYEFSSIPEEATSIAFRVRAKDSNNQYGDYVTGTYSTITRESPITVTTRTIEMNYFNGTDYEILYPVVGSEVYNHVKSGNYVGLGQYGQSNPNKLTLEFTPKVAMITKTSGVYDAYLLNGKTVSYVQSSTGVSEITVEWTGQTVSWYSADSVEAQLNENGVLYVYTVFG